MFLISAIRLGTFRFRCWQTAQLAPPPPAAVVRGAVTRWLNVACVDAVFLYRRRAYLPAFLRAADIGLESRPRLRTLFSVRGFAQILIARLSVERIDSFHPSGRDVHTSVARASCIAALPLPGNPSSRAGGGDVNTR